MSKYYDATVAWYENIAREGRENPSPHRRKICQNYLEHAALEYSNDRWREIFTPTRTVANPLYKVRWGTPETLTYEGTETVINEFYAVLKKSGGALTNENELLSVADWGFSSFHTSNLFRTGAQVVEEGFAEEGTVEPDGLYAVATKTAMYWLYDENALLIGEHVYEMEPPTVIPVSEEDWVSVEDLAQLIKPYLPHTAEVGSSDAFRGVS